jgi:hypothetical protein
MKKVIFSIFILSLTLLTACDKLPANGDLDGLWQLMEIREGNSRKDMKDSRMYCSFQLKLFMLGSEKAGARAYFGYFERTGSTIRFHHFTFRSDYTEDSNMDKLMTDADIDVIKPWGFYSTDCTFEVKELSSSRLVLSKDNTTIIYRKL